jgi:hypothetical protein
LVIIGERVISMRRQERLPFRMAGLSPVIPKRSANCPGWADTLAMPCFPKRLACVYQLSRLTANASFADYLDSQDTRQIPSPRTGYGVLRNIFSHAVMSAISTKP